ncbi:MAG: hypothetical protein ACI4TD_10640 [Phocaeicola sp.]
MRIKHYILFLCCTSVFTACKDEEYVYPSVLTEMVDIKTDSSGKLSYIDTDYGSSYKINERSGLEGFTPDSVYRTLSIFETLDSESNSMSATLYSCQFVISFIPSTEDKFKDGIKTDPLDIERIWRSGDYINMVLDVKAKDKTHIINFIDYGINENPDGSSTLSITLYHNQNGDYEAFTKKAYASVPLWPYKEKLKQGDKIEITVNTYKEGITKREFNY